MQNPIPHTERQHWIGVLARARRDELQPHEAALRDIEYQLIRAPEIGMTLVRGRMGGNGAPFNVGEMSVTRCVVRLADGRTGYSYLADATRSTPNSPPWPTRICRARNSVTGWRK